MFIKKVCKIDLRNLKLIGEFLVDIGVIPSSKLFTGEYTEFYIREFIKNIQTFNSSPYSDSNFEDELFCTNSQPEKFYQRLHEVNCFIDITNRWGIKILPAEDREFGGPDFKFQVGGDSIGWIEAVSPKLSYSLDTSEGVYKEYSPEQYYSMFNKTIANTVKQKLYMISRYVAREIVYFDEPVVLAIDLTQIYNSTDIKEYERYIFHLMYGDFSKHDIYEDCFKREKISYPASLLGLPGESPRGRDIPIKDMDVCPVELDPISYDDKQEVIENDASTLRPFIFWGRFRYISAVIFTHNSLTYTSNQYLLHNPLSCVPLPLGLISITNEITIEDVSRLVCEYDGVKLESYSHTD